MIKKVEDLLLKGEGSTDEVTAQRSLPLNGANQDDPRFGSFLKRFRQGITVKSVPLGRFAILSGRLIADNDDDDDVLARVASIDCLLCDQAMPTSEMPPPQADPDSATLFQGELNTQWPSSPPSGSFVATSERGAQPNNLIHSRFTIKVFLAFTFHCIPGTTYSLTLN